MKALIIDNEPGIRKNIRLQLQAFCPFVDKVYEAGGVSEGISKIESVKPDIVFLDVEMDDGTGFDLMSKINNATFQLVFVTAHNKYAIDAFRFSAIDYLLKPLDPEALQLAVEKAKKNIQNTNLSKQIEFLLQQVGGKHDADRKIVLRDIDNIYFVRLIDILYCLAERTYTRFFFNNRPPILVSKNLKEYESLLEPLGFIRSHHSFLINPAKIIRYDKSDGGSLVLEGEIRVPLAQRKKEWVLNLLEKKF